MKKIQLIVAALFVNVIQILAQATFDPSRQNQWLIDRMEIKSGAISKYIHTSQKLYSRDQIANMTDSFPVTRLRLSKIDYYNLDYLLIDNSDFTLSEKGLNRNQNWAFYKQKAALYSLSGSDFKVYVNPVLDMQFGRDNITKKNIYTNTRGIEIRGNISSKVGFYSLILENQIWAPTYLQKYIVAHGGVVPGAGFIKPFKTSKYDNAYDFFNSRAYITFSATKNIRIQFGQDRNFIGNGYRSFILSDWANEYPFLKIQSKFGPFQYQNLFAKMSHFTGFNIGLQPQDKYMALHHLSYNVTKRLNIGVFESIIFERNDSGQTKGFDISYLNPVIFYRSAEQNNNSSDNQTLGLDWKWNIIKTFSFYGQVVFDEFIYQDLKKQNGKWTNKYAIQAGLKYIDVCRIRNLDYQLEFNLVRPYTYTHFRTSTNYAHYGMPLAHPQGANFYEWVNIMRWQPIKKLYITGKLIYTRMGLDSGKTHYGSNIFIDYHQRIGASNPNYMHNIGDGVKTEIQYLELLLSYMVKHNLYFDMQVIYRRQKSDYALYTYNNALVTAGVRMNLYKRDYSL